MTNSVAEDVQTLVGRIFAEGDPLARSVFAQSRLWTRKQRANQLKVRINRRRRGPGHARQARQARAAQQSHEKKLDLIIGMMRESDFSDALLLGNSGEKLVPKLPRSHLDGKLL